MNGSDDELNRLDALAFGEATSVGADADQGDPAMKVWFLEAGFCDQDAERGATMLRSGQYFGFADAATSLFNEAVFDVATNTQFYGRNRHVTGERIAAVEARIDAVSPSLRENGGDR